MVEARCLIDRFRSMVRKRIEADLDPWIVDVSTSVIVSFAHSPLTTDHLSDELAAMAASTLVAPIAARIERIDFRTASRKAELAFSMRCQRSATWIAYGNAFAAASPSHD